MRLKWGWGPRDWMESSAQGTTPPPGNASPGPGIWTPVPTERRLGSCVKVLDLSFGLLELKD